MDIESVAIGDLKPDGANARKHDKKNLAAIKGSLKEFGQQKPIVVDTNGIVIAGNGTLEAAKALGWTHLDVVRTGLDATKRAAFALADNRTAELATWDDKILANTLKALKDLEFPIEDIGFSLDLDPVQLTGDEDKVPEVDGNPHKVELGQIWQLGPHRLMCGDSTSKENLEALLAGQEPDLVFTDPPYRMQAEGGSNQEVGKSARKLGERIKHLCDFDPLAFLENLNRAFPKGKMNAYVFCNKDLVPDYLNWGTQNGYSFNILFWKKPNAIPLGGSHRPDVEYLLLFRKSAIWNNALKNVSYSRCLEFGRENSTDHPTMKPVELIVNEILISSNKSSVVLDFFLGSGSTLIACQKTDRSCFGMELDPHFCSVIIERWQQITGQYAKILIAGKNTDYGEI